MAVSLDDAWMDSLSGADARPIVPSGAAAPPALATDDAPERRRRKKSARLCRSAPVESAEPLHREDVVAILEEVRAFRLDEAQRTRNTLVMFIVGVAVVTVFFAFTIHCNQKVNQTISYLLWSLETAALTDRRRLAAPYAPH